MPWNPAAFSPPEAGPGEMPTLAGLNIGGGAGGGAEGPDRLRWGKRPDTDAGGTANGGPGRCRRGRARHRTRRHGMRRTRRLRRSAGP